MIEHEDVVRDLLIIEKIWHVRHKHEQFFKSIPIWNEHSEFFLPVPNILVIRYKIPHVVFDWIVANTFTAFKI